MAKKQQINTTSGMPDSTPESSPQKSALARCVEAIHSDDDLLTRDFAAESIRNLIADEFHDHLILILYDDASISDFHAHRLYAAASKMEQSRRPILLILHSPGGRIEPAYLTSKALKRMSNSQFKVAIPRQAKSAATLLSLGATEIHMGMLSQLGPIDPQLGGLPALALSNALEVIAEVSCRYPGSTEMLTGYLSEQIPIRHLGYFQRINESAVQYAERLLADKTMPNDRSSGNIAHHLVNHYKDHNFVIDVDEAMELLGSHIVKNNTDAYQLSDTVFNALDLISFFLEAKGKRLVCVGKCDHPDSFQVWTKNPPNSATTQKSSSSR